MADMSVNKKKKENAKSKGILQRPVCGWKQRSQEVSRCPPVCPHAASAGSKGLLKNLSATNLPVNVQHLQIERIFLTVNFRQSNHTIIWRWFWIIFLSDIALEATYLKKSDTPNGRCSKDLKKASWGFEKVFSQRKVTCPLLPKARTTMEAETTSKSGRRLCFREVFKDLSTPWKTFPLSQKKSLKNISEQKRIRARYSVRYQLLAFWHFETVWSWPARLHNWQKLLKEDITYTHTLRALNRQWFFLSPLYIMLKSVSI